MSQKVRDLATVDNGFGTIGGEKADMVWEDAQEHMNDDVTEFVDHVGYVSESYARKVLKELPPESFGL